MESPTTVAGEDRLRIHIRWMIRKDMEDVLAIERDVFQFPWFEEDFIRCLRQRNCIGLVATAGPADEVVGFMIYELHKKRLHVLSFAVRRESQRRRVGSQMVEKLLGKLSTQKRVRITLEVRETNLPAQFFFASHGFRAVRVLRDYYEDATEDAYLFQFRHISDDDDYPTPPRHAG